MFGKKNTTPKVATAAPVARVTTVLGPGISWKGDLRGKGGVRIEGSLEGDVAIRGLVIVGETGRVTGENIKADTVIVAGTVKGHITAQKLEVRATGRVYGDVNISAFSTDEGAFLRGKVTMEESVDLPDLPPEGENPQLEDTSEADDGAESTQGED